MFKLEIKGLDRLQNRISNLPKQVRFAASQALNDAAFAARTDLRQLMPQVFDRPTPYIVDSVKVIKKAARDRLTVELAPKYPGGKGVEPADVLRAEVFGGGRKLKSSERAFARVGILPPGHYMVPSKQLLASEKADQYGNVKRGFIQQLLAYLQAFGEQGFKSNMTDKRKRQLAKFGRTAGGFKRIGGVQYFVSHGQFRPGSKAGHLPAGIWQRSGTHGADVKPVFLFVKPPSYRERFDMAGTIEGSFRRVLPGAMQRHLLEALRTAR